MIIFASQNRTSLHRIFQLRRGLERGPELRAAGRHGRDHLHLRLPGHERRRHREEGARVPPDAAPERAGLQALSEAKLKALAGGEGPGQFFLSKFCDFFSNFSKIFTTFWIQYSIFQHFSKSTRFYRILLKICEISAKNICKILQIF